MHCGLVGPSSSGSLSRAMCQSRIVVKMCSSVGRSNSVITTVLKCRVYRGVTYVRPPPGGPIAHINCTSLIVRKAFSRSYHPLWSIHWRRSSMGGCAPNSSLLGMLRSSTKMTARLLPGGP